MCICDVCMWDVWVCAMVMHVYVRCVCMCMWDLWDVQKKKQTNNQQQQQRAQTHTRQTHTRKKTT